MYPWPQCAERFTDEPFDAVTLHAFAHLFARRDAQARTGYRRVFQARTNVYHKIAIQVFPTFLIGTLEFPPFFQPVWMQYFCCSQCHQCPRSARACPRELPCHRSSHLTVARGPVPRDHPVVKKAAVVPVARGPVPREPPDSPKSPRIIVVEIQIFLPRRMITAPVITARTIQLQIGKDRGSFRLPLQPHL